ncbi:hypothetical protein BKA63DRAFT_563250 [Paraphoma chrysanthemicola]|nr:hypothetical protein BKA63DRAFT_563250 [Paraphoma chrysanthemicola]
MSAQTTPISPTRFASALTDLPISSIYAKHAELRNSITHMQSSNAQLEDYARDNDDRECYEAVLENREVMKRFEERIELLRREVVEVRGLPWRPQGDEAETPRKVDLNGEAGQIGEVLNGHADGSGPRINGNGGGVQERNGDGAAAAEQNGNDDNEDGVFL